MANARRYLTDGLAILIGQGLSRGLGVLLLPILTMVFLPAQFGMSALATSYVSFVSVIALLGLDLTYLQSIPGAAKEKAEATARVIWTLALVQAVGAALIGSAAWWIWGKQTPESTPWLALGIFATMVFSICQSQMKVEGKYLRLAMAMSAGGLVMYAWVLWRGFSGHNQAVTLVSGYAMGAAAAVLVSRPSISVAEAKPSLSEIWQIVRIGLPAAFTAPVFWIISSMDRWLIAQFWGVSEAGIYSVAASISGMGLLFGAVVQSVWLTEASRLYNATNGDCNAKLAERITEICFMFALTWLGLIAFSDEIVHLFAKPPFSQSLVYLPWLMTSVMLYGMCQALSVYLIISNTFNKSTIVWLAGGSFFVLTSLILAKSQGPIVIAIAQSMTYALMLFWLYRLVQRNYGLTIKAGTALYMMIALLVTGALLASTQRSEFDWLRFMLKFAVVATFSGLVAWNFRKHLAGVLKIRAPHD